MKKTLLMGDFMERFYLDQFSDGNLIKYRITIQALLPSEAIFVKNNSSWGIAFATVLIFPGEFLATRSQTIYVIANACKITMY